MQFGEGLDRKVDMSKVKMDAMRPWITQRISTILGLEDEVVVNYIFNQLEETRVSCFTNQHFVLR